MQKIRIDFDNPGLPQHISAVENDSQSRFFQATLYENGKAYTAPEGATYSIMYRGFGPQNQGWYDTINDGAGNRAACAVSGNVVTCEIARQALQVPGHVSIVLCVTTGKGYMLKSWPIECDCKNDRYDSTVEIQSFFYITQVSNADWNQAIQAWEDLKNTIDPTLSVSGKAADAAKVGEAVNAEAERAKGVEGQIKEDLSEVIETDNSYNIFDETTAKSQYIIPTGSVTESESYICGDVNVAAGDILKFYAAEGKVVSDIFARWVCAYGSNGMAVESLGSYKSVYSFTIPSGITRVSLTFPAIYKNKIFVTKNTDKPQKYEPYHAPTKSAIDKTSRFEIAKLKQNLVEPETHCALIRDTLRQTVGIPQSWYLVSAVTPQNRIVELRNGSQVFANQMKLELENNTAKRTGNGYRFTIYDKNLRILDTFVGAGYGNPIAITNENLPDSCSVLVIGDSTVDHDKVTGKMLSYFKEKGKTLNLLGTLGEKNNPLNKNEGRAGWSTKKYLENGTYDDVVNPFYNPNTKTFDFSYYMNNQGYNSPDYVVVQLGINDLYLVTEPDYDAIWNALKTIIDSIRTFDNAIKIIVNLPTTPNSNQNKHSVFEPLYRNRVITYNSIAIKNIQNQYGSNKVRVSYCHLILDPDTEIRDNVHPTDAGYEKMGMEVINQINNWHNGQ